MCIRDSAHGDHFAPVIFDLEKEAVRETFFRTESGENPRITYILSRDIGPRRVPADVTSPVIFLKSRETWQENDIRVETCLLYTSFFRPPFY